jgi:hypothetical protein
LSCFAWPFALPGVSVAPGDGAGTVVSPGGAAASGTVTGSDGVVTGSAGAGSGAEADFFALSSLSSLATGGVDGSGVFAGAPRAGIGTSGSFAWPGVGLSTLLTWPGGSGLSTCFAFFGFLAFFTFGLVPVGCGVTTAGVGCVVGVVEPPDGGAVPDVVPAPLPGGGVSDPPFPGGGFCGVVGASPGPGDSFAGGAAPPGVVPGAWPLAPAAPAFGWSPSALWTPLVGVAPTGVWGDEADVSAALGAEAAPPGMICGPPAGCERDWSRFAYAPFTAPS